MMRERTKKKNERERERERRVYLSFVHMFNQSVCPLVIGGIGKEKQIENWKAKSNKSRVEKKEEERRKKRK